MEGVDAGFLYMETHSMHMHTLKIAVLEAHQGLTFERFKEGVTDRLHMLPPMRRKVVPVPFRLNHPVWVTQESIDPSRHLFRHTVPGQGTMRDLERLIGEIASTPLDRSVPLWELHYCEGLADGGVAVVGKIHHALADGVAANSLLASVADLTGPGLAPVTETDRREFDTPPSSHMVWQGLRDAFLQIALLPMLLFRTFRGLWRALTHRRSLARGSSGTVLPRPMLDAPRVSFNGPLTPRRVYATCTLPLDRIKDVRRTQPGVTLNDVVLAVVSGALRSWMEDRGERPRASLIAGVPVSTDAPDALPRLGGNRVSNLFTTLATDVDDPVARLHYISQVTAAAKTFSKRLGPTMLTEWVQFTPPAPFHALMRGYSRIRAASWHPAPFNVIVSNVPGPREPVAIGLANVRDLFSVGPILEGVGLNVTVWSYVGQMNFSLLSCPELLPDVAALAAYFEPALNELERAVAT
jgi:diacylglycerol O-acyltransferase